MQILSNIWNDEKKRNESIALGLSIFFHLLLLLIVVKLTIEQPQLEQEEELESFEVMLGEEEEGSGEGTNIDPQRPLYKGPTYNSNPLPPAASSTPSSSRQTNNRSSSNTDNKHGLPVKRSTSSNSSSQSSRTSSTRSTSTNTNNNSTSSRNTGQGNSNEERSGRAVFGNRNSGSGVGRGQGSGQGDGGRSGNKGDPQGIMHYSLSSRKLVNSPGRFGNFSENGTVKIKIYVDRNGSVIRHRVLSATSSSLSNLAVQKLSQVKFNVDRKAPPEQQGTVTFKFRLR